MEVMLGRRWLGRQHHRYLCGAVGRNQRRKVATSSEGKGGSAPAGAASPERERPSFDVTGSLLDARRGGLDVPAKGQWMQLKHTFPQEAVDAFARHAGDDNPIHLDEEYARASKPRSYEGCVVHGLLASGLISSIFGRSIPGALYVSQMLKPKVPTRSTPTSTPRAPRNWLLCTLIIYVGAPLTARVEVQRARVTGGGGEVLVKCSTSVTIDATEEVAIEGDALVMLPKNTASRGV